MRRAYGKALSLSPVILAAVDPASITFHPHQMLDWAGVTKDE